MTGAGLSVGVATGVITPRTPCHLYGYAARSHPHDAVHDDIRVRALCVRDALGIEALVVSAEILWYGAEAAAETHARLHAELGIPPERVLLAGTHTHSAPMTGGASCNREWRQVLVAQTVAACAVARLNARPAGVRIARGACDIGVNRRERRPDGRIVLGKNPPGPRDREIVGVAFDRDDGRPVARLGVFACHGVVMGQESYALSADWPGAAARRIESAAGVPFLLLQGGAGNINPVIGPQSDFAAVDRLGGEFADVFLGLSWAGPEQRTADVQGRLLPLRLPRKQGGEQAVSLHGLRLGPVRLGGFPGEVFSETARAVKEAAAGVVAVCSYVDHGDDGYLPVAKVYPEGGYEVDTTPYSPEAEAIVRRALIEVTA